LSFWQYDYVGTRELTAQIGHPPEERPLVIGASRTVPGTVELEGHRDPLMPLPSPITRAPPFTGKALQDDSQQLSEADEQTFQPGARVPFWHREGMRPLMIWQSPLPDSNRRCRL
jgi:hypothetical protein